MERKGPGILLRDLLKGDDSQIQGVANVITHVAPDVLLLTAFDFDADGHALRQFVKLLRESGIDYPYFFSNRSNSGVPTNLDVDGDGWFGDASDAQGFGEFSGQGGLALLSKFPILLSDIRDFSEMLWRDFPGARISVDDPVSEVLRLSSTSHWDVPFQLPDGQVMHLMAFHAGTPAFGGPANRNVDRNHDEVAFWTKYLDGEMGVTPPKSRYAIIGDANLDPTDGQGESAAISALLNDPRLNDPMPKSKGAAQASKLQGGVNARQTGDPSMDTADWADVDGPGNLRVDYVLPSGDLEVLDAGVFWPASNEPEHALLSSSGTIVSRHALVWVDLGW